MPIHKALHAAILGTALLAPLAAQNQNTSLLQHWTRTSSSVAYSDVWGMTTPDGKEYAIIGERAGISILDATDPRNVKPLGFFAIAASSYAWRDYTSLGRYFFAVSEHHRGIRVFEMLTNGTVKDHGFVQTATVTSAHNIRSDPDTGYLYVLGGNNRGMAIFDASKSPTNPTFLAVWNTNYIHDACIRRGKAYVCTGQSYQTRILDIRNTSNITQIGTCLTAAGYNHSAWVAEDDKLLCVCDEIARNGVTPHMTVWDISNPAAPVKKGDYDPGGGAIAHNVFVIGRTAYMSYYVDGFHMIDLADPGKPTKVASYKTSTMTTRGYYGTWGAFAFQDSGTVYLSDMQRGFFAIQVDCGHMNRFGTGTAGSAGVARARFDGAVPRVGASQLRLEAANLEPNQPFWVAVSAGSAPNPSQLLGANVHVDLAKAVIIGPLQADAQGRASLPAPVPNDANLANAKAYIQLFSHRGNGTLASSRGMWAGICR